MELGLLIGVIALLFFCIVSQYQIMALQTANDDRFREVNTLRKTLTNHANSRDKHEPTMLVQIEGEHGGLSKPVPISRVIELIAKEVGMKLVYVENKGGLDWREV